MKSAQLFRQKVMRTAEKLRGYIFRQSCTVQSRIERVSTESFVQKISLVRYKTYYLQIIRLDWPLSSYLLDTHDLYVLQK